MKRKLLSIEVARGIAALLVVLFHVTLLSQRAGAVVLGGAFAFGHAGVELFFVLSGFIILTVHYGDIGDAHKLPRYIRSRFRRIFPPYWAVVAVIVPVYLAVPSLGYSDRLHSAGTFLNEFFLLPGPLPRSAALISVAWTLHHEMLFYGLFALLIVWPRVGMFLMAAWQAAVVGLNLAGSPLTSEPTTLYFSQINLGFPIGMLAAELVRRRLLRFPVVTAASGVLMFAAVGVLDARQIMSGAAISRDPAPTIYSVLFLVASGLIVAGLAAWDQRDAVQPPRPLVFLGAASYWTYLIHTPILILVFTLAARLHIGNPYIPGAVGVVLALAASSTIQSIDFRRPRKPHAMVTAEPLIR